MSHIRLVSSGGRSSGWIVDGRPVLLAGRHQNPMLSAFPGTADIANTLTETLVAGGKLLQFNSILYFLSNTGRWLPLTKPEQAAMILTQNVTFGWYVLRGQAPDLTKVKAPAASQRADMPLAEALIEGSEIVSRKFDCPLTLAKHLSGPAFREHVPTAAGFLNHPVAGETDWVQTAPLRLPEPTPDCRHLKALFSAFQLDPASHAALYMYLLGSLHAISLDYERPILYVDSWQRGRGKSEVTRALASLINGTDDCLGLSSLSRAVNDEIVAFLVNGRRLIGMHNLDGKVNYNSELMVSMATDGGVGSRPKYGRESQIFRGIMPVMNGVYGSASLHSDLVKRIWRVELRGTPGALEPRPAYYAQKHRLEILSEALACLLAPPVWGNGMSRCGPFEQVAGDAYVYAFTEAGVPWAHIQFEKMLAGRRALEQTPMRDLYRHHKELFEAPAAKVVVDATSYVEQAGPEFAGACALGKTFDGEKWQ